MRYFPAFVDVSGTKIVVVGGGEKAVQKLRLLAKTNADVRVVARQPSAGLEAIAGENEFTILRQDFDDEIIDGARLVFVAEDDPRHALTVAEVANRKGVAVNVVDRPALSSFIVPAIVDRDPVMVAIGTEGTAPVLGRDIKAKLESWLPARIGEVARRAAGLRERIGYAVADPLLRRKVWERLLRGRWRKLLLDGREREARAELEHALGACRGGAILAGRVSLVGAGPGDADLLTLKAQQRLQEADVLVIDDLVAPQVLEYARRDAKRIHVGKKGYGPATCQGRINAILVREAAKGQHVVRLKGGDPFVFGRAVEELTAVRAAGIDVDIVPGVTAAHACAASIGLPVTMRGQIRQFSLVTGATGHGLPQLDWPLLARPGHAVAVYMGVRSAPDFRARLLSAGARPDLSVVVVENGTRQNERVFATTLDLLPEAIESAGIKGPAIVFLGLSWKAANLTPPDRVEWYLKGTAGEMNIASERPGKQSVDDRNWTAEDIAKATFWVAG